MMGCQLLMATACNTDELHLLCAHCLAALAHAAGERLQQPEGPDCWLECPMQAEEGCHLAI